MYFHEDEEEDLKNQMFKNKYGKLSNNIDIQKKYREVSNQKISNNQDSISHEQKLLEKKTKRRHDSSDEEESEKEIEKKDSIKQITPEKKEENWKKGFINIEESQKNKIELKEMSKIINDPMKNLLSVNKNIEESNELAKKRGFYLPRCKFSALNNRFDIKPGYRWDGVNRSNGFENQILNIRFNINK